MPSAGMVHAYTMFIFNNLVSCRLCGITAKEAKGEEEGDLDLNTVALITSIQRQLPTESCRKMSIVCIDRNSSRSVALPAGVRTGVRWNPDALAKSMTLDMQRIKMPIKTQT